MGLVIQDNSTVSTELYCTNAFQLQRLIEAAQGTIRWQRYCDTVIIGTLPVPRCFIQKSSGTILYRVQEQ